MDRSTTLSPRGAARPALVLLATSLGVLVAQVDTSVVTLAVKRIGADLGATVSGMQWTIDAYNVTYGALLLTGGALGDLYGRRRVFAWGIALFALGSILCAAATGNAALLAGRALSGLGAALELPMSLVLLAEAYPEAGARQQALGIWASCNGIAFIVGPTVGGLLVDTAGWRSIFYLVLPLCAAALALAYAAVEESASPAGRRLDPAGQVAAIAALAAAAFTAIEGSHLGWSAVPVIAAAGVALASAAAFVLVERRQRAGLVPFELFASRPFSAALAIAGLMTFGMYALLFLMPLYFQSVRGDTPFVAGVRLLPLSIVFVAVSRWSGRIVRTIGVRAAMAGGMAAMGAGELGLAFVSAGTPTSIVSAALAVVGVGLGLNTAPVNSVAVANVARERGGTASGLLNTARIVGATLGIAILGAVFAHYAGQQGSARDFLAGLRPALMVGGFAEMLGALVALRYIAPHSGTARG